MKHYQTNDIKNLVLVGSSKSGKTTLAECMMYEGGVISRMGSVDDGNTVSDYNEIEHERKNSIFSSVLHTEWRGAKLNILDTPGSDDFIGEVISSLRVADTALVTLHAQYGVEVGTEIVWRYLHKYRKPSVFVINHLDNAKADYDLTVEQLRQQFGSGVVVMQYPYRQGEGFNAIIDLLKMVMYQFPDGGGKPEKLPIPAEERANADELHNVLVEAAAEHDETLMELYFEKGELDEDELRKGLRIGMLARELFPVFCVSARRNMGSGRLMGFLGNVAPSAGEIHDEVSTDGKKISVTDPETTLFVFKSINEKHTGAMSVFKVCSGEVSAGMELINTSSRSKGKMNQLYIVDGKNRTAVDKLSAGDIGATVKFKDTHTNHTLRSKDDGVEVLPIVFPSPRIRTAVSPIRQSDDEKMGQAFHRLHEADPTLLFNYSKELRQSILQGQGEMHLQMAKRMLSSVYGVEVEFHQPRISYRETIRSKADGYYKHKKQSGGSGQYAEVYLRVEAYSEHMADPSDIKIRDTEVHELPWGGKLLFCNCIVGGVIDGRFMPAILKGILEVMESGPVTGSYARDVRVLVYDGKMHAVDSNEISFKIAGQQAFKQAFLEASPLLLEPIYQVEVLAPEEYTGEIMTDMQGRRAIVGGIATEGTYQKITARVPLAELNRYTTTLSSISQGRATYSQEFADYAQVPGDIQARLMAERMTELAH
jgi:elongation factor G